MSQHAIIVIKNEDNKYLQYYDNRWNSYLFLNCKVNDSTKIADIKEYIANTLHLKVDNIDCRFVGRKTHTKFSVSHNVNKEYQHYFYEVLINKSITLQDNYKWFSYNELLEDKRIQEVNSDIISFVKEFDL